VVVVREERGGALRQKILQRRLGRNLRGLAQARRGQRELALVFEVVRHERERRAGAADDGKEPGGPAALGLGQRLDPALELGFRRPVAIIPPAFRIPPPPPHPPLPLLPP